MDRNNRVGDEVESAAKVVLLRFYSVGISRGDSATTCAWRRPRLLRTKANTHGSMMTSGNANLASAALPRVRIGPADRRYLLAAAALALTLVSGCATKPEPYRMEECHAYADLVMPPVPCVH